MLLEHSSSVSVNRRNWIRPSTDPTAANSDTTRHVQLNIFNHVQVMENLGILALAMYISMGKYTVNGQNDAAPMSPRKSLKNGKIIARTTVTTTYADLQTSLNKLT
ncbi:unnamed protein product [Linum trigynum]|uniref:Uncharacterized protein n=1 Tax=Linum trigynum TaxID=586398 RepID=A0AAV2FD44_9ROSI